MQQSTHASEANAPEPPSFLGIVEKAKVLAVVRADSIPDVVGLCEALVQGGISIIELTFTIPDLTRHLDIAARAADQTGALVGAGTVLDARDAQAAVDAGARFLVTPGLGREAAEIVRIGHAASAAVVLGALTPSEVLTAVQHDADAVKIFPARSGGPQLLNDLRGPFPDVRLVPSGGVTIDNARAFLDAGALAVSAGTGVVPPTAVQSSDWARISDNARAFCAALTADDPR